MCMVKKTSSLLSVFILQGSVVCVDKIPVRYKYEVQLKLKASSKCVSTGLDLSHDNLAESGEIILYNSSSAESRYILTSLKGGLKLGIELENSPKL